MNIIEQTSMNKELVIVTTKRFNKLGRPITRRSAYHNCLRRSCVNSTLRIIYRTSNFSRGTKEGLAECNKCKTIYEYKGTEIKVVKQNNE